MKTWQRAAIVALALALATLAGSHRAYLFYGNLHAVVPGEIYRAAQPSDARLERWRTALGLRAVLNLKGSGVAKGPTGEDTTSLEWHSVRMSARRLPSPGEVARLIEVFDTAERPLLVHCHGGTDRSGLASAVALLLDGRTTNEARRQFALRFGYPGRTLGSVQPDFIDHYDAWLASAPHSHTAARFREWVTHHYVVDYYEASLAITPAHEPLRAGAPFSLHVEVTNRSSEAIPMRCDAGAGVRLSLRAHALDDASQGAPGDRRFCAGDADLAPGERVRIEAPGFRIQHPGRYAWKADLVDERREQWFEQMGSPPARRILFLH